MKMKRAIVLTAVVLLLSLFVLVIHASRRDIDLIEQDDVIENIVIRDLRTDRELTGKNIDAILKGVKCRWTSRDYEQTTSLDSYSFEITIYLNKYTKRWHLMVGQQSYCYESAGAFNEYTVLNADLLDKITEAVK
ncbi:MAG: hypothetical protein IJS38_03435 [Erysipelotrichaceae bacterium]|nr:hypothetical protein [Erysipelotrichaceae bacterium]